MAPFDIAWRWEIPLLDREIVCSNSTRSGVASAANAEANSAEAGVDLAFCSGEKPVLTALLYVDWRVVGAASDPYH
ncbi:hypothetical protein GCM10011410_26810 [Hoyosella rhizosphaerae]|uniref:Uncharacterized protein n=1 Tax=Hoyosella rhizosphaerae TaxID=1755582 RepID=A0A916UG73_9ACTN|nr:hypothetical protein GCM10011410_26810 [Hoyosella rhizosphaerae]